MKIIARLIIVLFLVTSCQTVQYISDFSSSTDFKPYKTYNFMQWNEKNNQYLNGIDKQTILSSLETEMTALGFTKSDAPDVMVNVNVIIQEKTGTQAYTTYMGGYYMPFGYGVTTYQEYSYLVGTLVIDMFDEKSKQQVWHGAAVGEVQEGNERKEENIARVINRIMKRYPIQPETK